MATRRLPLHLACLLLAGALLAVPLTASVQTEQARAAANVIAASDPVIAAAGDIACDPTSSSFNGGLGSSSNCRQKYTSDLLLDPAISAVLLLGDNQYYCGGYQAFVQSYDKSWGRVKAITRPAVGNHEYLTSGGTDCNSGNAGAAGYFRYFGLAAGDPGKGYYSYDIAAWHFIVLNSECTDAGGCGSTSPQGVWLRNDLAAHPNSCTLAYWHIPLFSSGGRASSRYKTFWDALYAADADVVLNGHDHIYERFAPQRPDGTADAARGIREFVVGTGGSNHTSLSSVFANSQVRDAKTYGVLRLTLHPTSYDWQFVPEAGATFTDSGTDTCHGVSTDTTPPTAPTNLAAAPVAPNRVNLSWTASSDNVGVSAYRISRNGTVVASVAATSYADTAVLPSTAYAYTVSAVDAGGNVSPASNVANATTPSDTTKPTAPTGVSATAVHGFQVDVRWTASSDDLGVVGYEVFRNGVPVGTSTSTFFADQTVDAETTYSYTVTARDGAGNVSDSSSAAVVATPVAPTTLTLAPSDDAYVQSDQPSANFGAAGQIIVDASPVRRAFLKFTVAGVRGRQVVSAKLRLRCLDPSPSGGSFRRVGNSSWSESTLTWTNQPVADAAAIASLGSVAAGTTYEVDVTSLVAGDGTYTLAVDSSSSDAANYASKETSTPAQLVVTIGSGAPDTTPPTAPANLTANAPTGNAVNLSWTASTDNVAVVAYDVFRDGVATPLGSTSATSFSDTTVQPGTTYSYSVVARDGAGNASPASGTAQVTTPASSTVAFAPAADTYVESGLPTANFGSATSIHVDNSPVKHFLLKFTVTGIGSRTVASARLRLYCVDPASVGGDFHRLLDTSWSESAVTWNTAPAAEAATFAALGTVAAGNWYEVSVPFVTADGTYAFRVTSTSTNGADFSSKEGSFPPQLVVTVT